MKNGAVRVLTVTVTAARVARPSRARVRLEFHSPASGSYTVMPGPEVAAGAGINVVAGAGPVIMTEAEHGLLLKQEWWAIASGTVTGAVVEVVAE